MKHSDAQSYLARLYRSLYDDSPEKEAVRAASLALSFVHSLACHNGPTSIPVQTLFKRVSIEAEPETVLLKPLPDINHKGGKTCRCQCGGARERVRRSYP